MAQTGYTPILIYSSTTAAQAPVAGNLTNSTLGSELAINITDGKLFYKDNANAVQVIGWKVTPTSAGGTGLTSYTAGDMLYYASGTALSKLGIGAANTVMTSSGSAPQWSTALTLSGNVTAAAFIPSSATVPTNGLFLPAANSVGIAAGSAEIMRWAAGSAQLRSGAALYVYNATNDGLGIWYNPGGAGVNQLVGRVNGADRLTIQGSTGSVTVNSGNFGVGLTPNAWADGKAVEVGYSGNAIWGVAAANDMRILSNAYWNGTNYKYANNGYANMFSVGDQGGQFNWYTAPSGTAGNNISGANQFGLLMRLDPTTYNLKLTSGNFEVGTSGKGIDFSATPGTGTSELLADYEEGTFTPTIVYSGTNTPTYAYQLGRYTKIGRIVQVQMFFSWNENGSTGNVTIGSLPFTSVTSLARPVPSILSYGLTGLPANVSVTGFVNSNATTISLFLNDNAATTLSATYTDNDQDMYVTVTYEAA